MWYLHIHLMCAKLFVLLTIKITFTFVIYWLKQLYYNGRVIFYNIHRAPAYRVVYISRAMCAQQGHNL